MSEKLKIGDELYFKVGYRDTLEISMITKITPSGRLICGGRTLNPNLSVRGGGGFGTPYRGFAVTDEIRELHAHQQLVSYFSGLKFKKLSLESLRGMKSEIRESREKREEALKDRIKELEYELKLYKEMGDV